jgi:hypothetical protein
MATHARRRLPPPPWVLPVALRVNVHRPAATGPPPLPAYLLRPACTRLADVLADATGTSTPTASSWALALHTHSGGSGGALAVHGWMSLGDLASLAGLSSDGDGSPPVVTVTATWGHPAPQPALIANARLAGRALFSEGRKQAAAAAGLPTSSRFGGSGPDGPAAALYAHIARGDAAAAVSSAGEQLAAALAEPAARRVPVRLLLASGVAAACGVPATIGGDDVVASPTLLQRPVWRVAPAPSPVAPGGPPSSAATAAVGAGAGAATTVRDALAAHVGDAGLAALACGDWEGVVDGVVLPLAGTPPARGPRGPQPPLLDAPVEALYRELAQPDGWLVVCVREAAR